MTKNINKSRNKKINKLSEKNTHTHNTDDSFASIIITIMKTTCMPVHTVYTTGKGCALESWERYIKFTFFVLCLLPRAILNHHHFEKLIRLAWYTCVWVTQIQSASKSDAFVCVFVWPRKFFYIFKRKIKRFFFRSLNAHSIQVYTQSEWKKRLVCLLKLKLKCNENESGLAVAYTAQLTYNLCLPSAILRNHITHHLNYDRFRLISEPLCVANASARVERSTETQIDGDMCGFIFITKNA